MFSRKYYLEEYDFGEHMIHPFAVLKENRIKIAAELAGTVSGDFTKEGQDERMKDPKMYNYFLLMVERSERDELERKLKSTQEKLKEISKELSTLKRK